MSTSSSPSPRWRQQYPFASQWLTLPAGRMHYVDEGPVGVLKPSGRTLYPSPSPSPKKGRGISPPTLLFVHGNPTWSFHWRRLIESLRDDFRCVAMDHLGCGLSDKPQQSFRLADRVADVGRLVDELDLKRVTLVSQDWGGAIGLGAMLDRQERLERILLFNTGAFQPWFVPKRIAICKTPLLGKLGLQGLNLFSRAALRMTLSRRRLDADTAAAYLAPYNTWANRRAVYEFVADIPQGPRHPTWETLGGIESRLPELARLPIRLVWGMKDWCFTPECLDRFQENWPNAEAVRLPDAGHWVVEDAPDECLQQLRDFVNAEKN